MNAIPPGHYAQKQLLSPSRLVRWSHGSRFRLARELVAPFAGRRLLDYGCGDGTFLAFVQDLFPEALGVDVAADQIADCASRFAGSPGIAFLPTSSLNDPRHLNRYELVVCMEVLEHCPDDIQVSVLDQMLAVTSPGGTVVISVPIEIGPPLAAKQGARALVALGGLVGVRHARALSAGRACPHAVCGRGHGDSPGRVRGRGRLALHWAQGVQLAAAAENDRASASRSSGDCSRRCLSLVPG